jgi:hypothetical protein
MAGVQGVDPMGFHVTLREDDRTLLRVLQENPSDIFGRPYAGYLLFLVGGADTVALDWLRKHLAPLDSLTGEWVAFALFAEKVPIRLEVPHDTHPRAEKFLGDVAAADVQRIDSYVRSGKLGLVADGDHLNAMTYATDRVARSFNVLDRLPCLVVLDAFPRADAQVIELRDSEMQHLLPLLRAAVHTLEKDPGFGALSAALGALAHAKNELALLKAEIQAKKYELSMIPVPGDVDARSREIMSEIDASLREAAHPRYKRQLAKLRGHAGTAAGIAVESDEDTRVIVRCGHTLKALSDFDTRTWPLKPSDLARYRKLVDTFVAPLVPECAAALKSDTRDAYTELHNAVRARQSRLIDSMIESLTKQIAAATVDRNAARRDSLHAELQKLLAKQNEVVERSRRAAQSCVAREVPSLSLILQGLAKERKIKMIKTSISDRVTGYAGKALSPEVILEALDILVGA